MKLKKAASAAVLLILSGCRPADTEEPVPSASALPPAEPARAAAGEFAAVDLSVVITGISLAEEYDGILPEGDSRFLVADICAANTSFSPVMIYDTDFQVSWGEGEEMWTLPLTAVKNGLSAAGMFPERYELAPGEEKQGSLVFAVPAGAGEMIFSMKDGDEVYCLTVQGE